MPKHVFVNNNSTVGVHWFNTKEGLKDEVGVSVGVGKLFSFDEEPNSHGETEEFDRLFFYFDSPEQVNAFTKALHKAKRKTFNA